MGYFHFAFLGPESFTAAEASECAADQDEFWAFHDLVYEAQQIKTVDALDSESLKKFAFEIGLDTDEFNECLDSGKYTDIIRTQTSTAQSLGVHSTPAFLINGIPILGAQPFENFQEIIEQELE